jgi:hypothetical protein
VGNKELFFAGGPGCGTYFWDWRYSGWDRVDCLRAVFSEEAQEYQLFVKLLKQLNCGSCGAGTSLKRGVNESLLHGLNEQFVKTGIRRGVLAIAIVAFLALPTSVRACAACYGQSDSPLATGVTWGILSLLVVVMAVLGSIVSFFVYINRRSAAGSQNPITDYQSPVINH